MPRDSQLTATHILVPVSLIAFTLVLLFAFQGKQILNDRDQLHQALGQQQKTYDEAVKVQAQLNALAVGTSKLAGQGNKSAKVIIDRLKAAGVSVNDGTAPAATDAPASPAPVPAASEVPPPSAVKP